MDTHDQAVLLRELFSCMFECSGSFQLPSVRHAIPVMRSIHSLRAVDWRDGSLIV